MSFQQLLTRADESVFQELLGADTVRVLNLLDPSLTTAKTLRQLLELRHPPISILRDRSKRRLLTDAMSIKEAANLCDQIGVNANGDPHAALKDLNIRKGSEQESCLLRFFGVPTPERDPNSTLPTEERIIPTYGLFKHQRDVARKAIEALEHRPSRALIHMPTGAGKTRTAMHVVAEYLRRSQEGLVIWLAHSEELCNQAFLDMSAAWKSIGNREITLYRFWSDHSIDVNEIRDGLIVAALPKMHSMAMKNLASLGSLSSKTILVVIDEGHKATASTYRDVIETLMGPDEAAGLLGLSATPGRSWDDISADEELAKFFNYQLIPMQIEGYTNPVEFLTDEGYLARPYFSSLYSTGGTELTEADRRLMESGLEIPNRVLQRLAEDEQRTLRILQATENLTRSHERILVFSTTVSHAHLLAAVLHARGIRAYAVTGDTPSSERRRALQIYQEGDSKPVVLTNYGVLTTGFDAPRTSAGVIARPTTSLVLYSQMVGRMMRGPKAGGNEQCEIITVVDRNLPGFSDMADAFTHWNNIWEEGK